MSVLGDDDEEGGDEEDDVGGIDEGVGKGEGGKEGILESASAAVLVLPGMWTIWRVNCSIFWSHLACRPDR